MGKGKVSKFFKSCLSMLGFGNWCSICGESLKGAAYSYQEVKRWGAGGQNIDIEVRYQCPHCGTEGKLRQTVHCQNGQNPQYQIDNFCRNKFGH